MSRRIEPQPAPIDGRPLTVLVCGDREWEDVEPVVRELSKLPPGSTVIHGGCRGADTVADVVARELGLNVRRFPADWKRFGTAAGPMRNREMLEKGKPHLVIAFHERFEASKGTKDMVEVAQRNGFPTLLFAA